MNGESSGNVEHITTSRLVVPYRSVRHRTVGCRHVRSIRRHRRRWKRVLVLCCFFLFGSYAKCRTQIRRGRFCSSRKQVGCCRLSGKRSSCSRFGTSVVVVVVVVVDIAKVCLFFVLLLPGVVLRSYAKVA